MYTEFNARVRKKSGSYQTAETGNGAETNDGRRKRAAVAGISSRLSRGWICKNRHLDQTRVRKYPQSWDICFIPTAVCWEWMWILTK